MDCITQASLTLGFQWIWPMGGISGGGRRIRELGGKRGLDIYFSSSLSARSHLAMMVFLYFVPYLLLGCPFPTGSVFTRLCSPSHFRTRMVTAFPCCWFGPAAQSPGPLYPAHTFSYTLWMCPLVAARTLADTNAIVELSHYSPGTFGQSTSLDGSQFLCVKKCWCGERWSGLLPESPFQCWHLHFCMMQWWSIASLSSSSLSWLCGPLWITLSGRWSRNIFFLPLWGSLLE